MVVPRNFRWLLGWEFRLNLARNRRDETWGYWLASLIIGEAKCMD